MKDQLKYPRPWLKHRRRELALILEKALPYHCDDNKMIGFCYALTRCKNDGVITEDERSFAIGYIWELIDPFIFLQSKLIYLGRCSNFECRHDVYKIWINKLRR